MSSASVPDQQATGIPANDSSWEDVSVSLTERVYRNNGNRTVIGLLNPKCGKVLDVGCGAGDNAALIRANYPNCEIYGITRSSAEMKRALNYMKECWVCDIEKGIPEGAQDMQFDAILFSHVLEHLKDPADVLASFTRLLTKGGQVIIAVPNVMYFRMRLQFLAGRFEYQPTGGIMDDTHLHFYTYFTADRYLLSKSSELTLKSKQVDAHLPLPFIRGRILPNSVCKLCDDWVAKHLPNLCGHQVVLTAEK